VSTGRFDDLVARLEGIEEELRDRAFDTLAQAADEQDETARAETVALERRIQRARRAVERARAALADGHDTFD
jgi:hypothetical protein